MPSVFSCPVCKAPLENHVSFHKCSNGHSFDIAKEGYVNLVGTSKRNSALSGDDRDMVKSRTLFLEGGHYNPLRDKIISLIKETAIENPVLLDSGCGEGYYTRFYCQQVQKMGGSAVGIDLSKSAIKHASKNCRDACFATASVYHLPILDDSIDVLVNCFSPLAPDEFRRVVKKGGYFFYVVPDKGHLWELKKVLYDVPYENAVKNDSYDGFEYVKTEFVKTSFTLDSKEKIMSLLHMTPYTWKTPKSGVERLSALEKLDVTAEFQVLVYRRNETE